MTSIFRCTTSILAMLLAGYGSASLAAQPVMSPAAIQPGQNEKHAFTLHAIGSQIYECKPAGGGTVSWAFVAPDAELFNDRAEKVGTHGAGPTWAAPDGSKTLGTVKARSDGEQPSDIPWLLLTAKSVGGPGVMEPVTSVQRVKTHGGAAPAQGCSTQADAGKSFMAAYTADYVFFTAK